eukprot:scaffold11209_cov99-Isochrysis_galbana.AAC.3
MLGLPRLGGAIPPRCSGPRKARRGCLWPRYSRPRLVHRGRRKTADTESNPVVFGRHCSEQGLDVLVARDHARQAQQRARRVVGVDGEEDIRLLGYWCHAVKKINKLLGRIRAGSSTRQTRQHSPAQRLPLGDSHPIEAPQGAGTADGVVLSIWAAQDAELEGGEVVHVECERFGPIGPPPVQLGPCPIEHRHEVVADDAEPALAQVAERLLVVGDVAVALGRAALDTLVHWHTLNNTPHQPGRLDDALALADRLHIPDVACWHAVQSRHDARRASLLDRQVCSISPVALLAPAAASPRPGQALSGVGAGVVI